jgi:hypothetical protein
VSLFCLFTVETVKCCSSLPVSIFLYNLAEMCAALFPQTCSLPVHFIQASHSPNSNHRMLSYSS